MAKKKKKNSKIIRFRRLFHFNIGMFIFGLIFLYMSFYVYTYIRKDKVQFYEVVEGDIVSDHEYTGLILREEHVQETDRAGYVNYFVREGKRASIGSRIYSIDETGSLAAFLEDNPDAQVVLTDENVADIKRQLSSFAAAWSDMDFDEVYNMYSTLEASVLEYVNFNTVGSLDALMELAGASFHQVNAPESGVVSYAIDGYEDLQLSQIQGSTFEKTGYHKAITKSGQLIERGAPVYKLVTSNNWSIVFPLTEQDLEEYGGRSTLHLTFGSQDLETEAAFSIISGSDGGSYGKLDFDKYMVQFIADRFVQFEVASERIPGLKIPVKAVTSKNFFLVPVDYIVNGGDSSDTGFMKESYTETGTVVSFVPTTIYYSTEEYYYIDMSEDAPIKMGDYLIKPDSTDRYQVGQSASLQGVYNINKGYAVFKQIDILNSNDEYYTIRKDMNYGLSVYDHIVLNAETVYEGELIYQ